MAVLAIFILNYHLLCFLSCFKNGYLNKAISSKSAERQLLSQEYLRLLYSWVGLGVGSFFVSDHTLTPLFFCIQNLMLPYPGLSGSACEYQERTSEKETCGETNEMRLQSLLLFILVYKRLLLARGDSLLWALAHCCRQGGNLGRETTAWENVPCVQLSLNMLELKGFSIPSGSSASYPGGFARWNAFCPISVLLSFTRILSAAKCMCQAGDELTVQFWYIPPHNNTWVLERVWKPTWFPRTMGLASNKWQDNSDTEIPSHQS